MTSEFSQSKAAPSVAKNMTIANPFRRLVAYLVDIMLLYALLVGIQLGLTYLTDGAIVNWFVLRDNAYLTFAWIFLMISFPMWLYFILSESSARQATVGKYVMGLKVTDLNGNRIKRSTAVWRTICKLVFFEIGHLSFLLPTPLFAEPEPTFRIGFALLMALMVIYFVVTLFTPRHQSVHDLIVKTLVVRRIAAVSGE